MDIKSSWMHHKISDGDKALMRFGIEPTNTFEFDSIMRQQYILQPTKIYVILNCTPRAKMPMIRRQWRCLGITQMLFTCDASSVWHRFLQNANNAMRSTSPRNVRWANSGGGGVVKKNTRIGENNRALCCGLQVTHTSTRNEIYPFRSYAYGIYVDDFGFFPPAILTHHRCMRWRDFQWNSKKRKTEYKIHDELDKRKLVGMALCAMCVRQQYGEQTPIANVGDIITIFSFRFIAVMWPTNETSVRTHAPCNRCQAIIAPTTCAYAHKMHERAHRTHTQSLCFSGASDSISNVEHLIQ